MLIEFAGQSAVDDKNRAAKTSRLINCYRQAQSGDPILKSVLGTEAFADVASVFMRDMIEVRGDMFVAAGGALHKVTAIGGSTDIGSILDGETILSSNNGKVVLTSGGNYYVWNGSTVTMPIGANFTDFGSVTFLSQYTVLTQDGGRQFTLTGIADPETLNTTVWSAEGRDDNIIRGMAINGRLVLFKEHSREIWYLTGQAGTKAVQRIAGGVADTGLKAKGLVAKIDQGAFFIGDDNIAYITDGMAQSPVSSTAVNSALSNGNPTRCFFYEDEGQKIVVIRFTDRPAWCLDLATMEWHERSQDVTNEPWSAVSAARIGTQWFVGTDLGKIHKLVRNNVDVDYPLVRTAISHTITQNMDPFTVKKIEIFARMGYSDLGRDAEMWINLSRDGGQIWGESKSRSLGDLGQYGNRAIWRAQGQFKRLTIKAQISEAAEIPMNGQFVLETT